MFYPYSRQVLLWVLRRRIRTFLFHMSNKAFLRFPFYLSSKGFLSPTSSIRALTYTGPCFVRSSNLNIGFTFINCLFPYLRINRNVNRISCFCTFSSKGMREYPFLRFFRCSGCNSFLRSKEANCLPSSFTRKCDSSNCGFEMGFQTLFTILYSQCKWGVVRYFRVF